MAVEQPKPREIVFLGKSEKERIANAQMFQIGVGIMQRYSQNFTPDEQAFMNVALGNYARFIEHPEGDEQSAGTAQEPQTTKLPPVPKKNR